jgi:glycosyltransferase involved in cell wall biosynthesis
LSERALANKRWRKHAYMRAVQRRVLDAQAAVHVLTSVEAAQVARQGVAAPVFEVPNGVPADLLTGLDGALADGLLRRFPQLRAKQVVLFLGRIVARKGPELLARCFASLADRFPDAALLVAGPPEEADTQRRMHAVLADAGVLHRVAFTGLLTGDDKLGALALARVFVLPSRFEGFPVAPVEAIAAGVPVVVSEHCNFKEVADADAGFVLPLDDIAFEKAISTLLADGHRRAAMGANGRRLAAERFAWSAIAESFAELYRRCAAERPTPEDGRD